jgi:hypothetical protein
VSTCSHWGPSGDPYCETVPRLVVRDACSAHGVSCLGALIEAVDAPAPRRFCTEQTCTCWIGRAMAVASGSHPEHDSSPRVWAEVGLRGRSLSPAN